jgi:hypothetical protein
LTGIKEELKALREESARRDEEYAREMKALYDLLAQQLSRMKI